MKKEMLINVLQPEESRIAILEDGVLEELYVERTGQGNLVGNIYKGRIVNIEPSIQAAFIDFGIGRNGFLHVSDVEAQYYKQSNDAPDEETVEADDRRQGSRSKPPIQTIFKRSQEVLVQVIKEAVGTKGPTLSTYISIPGRYLVLMPGLNRVGVSRKIDNDQQRRKLREILRELDPPKGLGFIVRTAGADRSKRDLSRDLSYLTRVWKVVVRRLNKSRCPAEIYMESDMIIRTIRDIFTNDIDEVWVDRGDAYEEAREFLSVTMPRSVQRLNRYEGHQPLFHRYGIEEEIDRIQQRRIPLPNGGSIVIDQTEALVAIDVNSGNFRADNDAEETAYRINLAAAREIARQLRLRDLGGVVVCDFIDMREERHRRDVEQSLREAVRRDRARTKVLRMSAFGLIEMTRQRIRPSLGRSVYEDCPSCQGGGLVKTSESVSLEVMRMIMMAANCTPVTRVDVEVHTDVAVNLTNRKRREIAELEERGDKRITIRGTDAVSPQHLLFRCLDASGAEVPKWDEWQGTPEPSSATQPEKPAESSSKQPAEKKKPDRSSRGKRKRKTGKRGEKNDKPLTGVEAAPPVEKTGDDEKTDPQPAGRDQGNSRKPKGKRSYKKKRRGSRAAKSPVALEDQKPVDNNAQSASDGPELQIPAFEPPQQPEEIPEEIQE